MFDLNSFIKKGLLDAVGKLADYQVALISVYWFDKHVLNGADMAEIATAINSSTKDDGQVTDATVDCCDYCLGELPNNKIGE